MLTRRQAGLLVVLTLLWGLNWPVMKFSLREMSPLWFRAVTMSGGVLALALFLRVRGAPIALPRAEIGRVAWLALPNIVGWHLFSILGLAALASGRAAILGFTMPVWTVLLAVALGAERASWRVAASAAAALGAVVLLSAQELGTLAGRPEGVLWMQLAAICWAGGTLLMRRTATPLSTEAVTLWMMVFGALVFWAAALAFEPAPDFAALSGAMWLALGYGVFLNFGVGQMLWFGLARELPPSASAFSIMAVPLVGLFSAAAIVGETPRASDLAAAACIVAAIAIALLRR